MAIPYQKFLDLRAKFNYIGKLMRKELLWAAGIGIFFGLIIAFGVWRINSTAKKESISTEATPTPHTSISGFSITLDKPEQNDVVTRSSVTVSGITKPLAWLTISDDTGDFIVQAGSDGVFSQDTSLSPGVNQIKITAFDPSGNQSVEKVVVVYSSSFQTQTIPTPSPVNNSTESAIQAKVKEKVAEALNKPKAYIGTVSDIADSTIEIKTTDSQIGQIDTGNDNISVVNTKGLSDKSIKLTDIAIGDFIVAMGYVNSKSVLDAQRILVSDPLSESKVGSYLGKVVTNDKKTLTVTSPKDQAQDMVTPGTKTDIESFQSGKLTAVKFSSISAGDMVIYVTDTPATTPVVRSIYVVQKAS